jgi:hypothetical protein
MVSLALGLLVQASQQGAWCAAVGFPSLGLVAAAQLGVRLDRLAVIPAPGEQWSVVVAALLDSVDLVLVAPPARVRAADARRLRARTRELGAVLIVVGAGWPESVDLELHVTAGSWVGLDAGHGHLQARQIDVAASGRGAAARPRRVRVWLPDAHGAMAAAPPLAAPTDGATVERAGAWHGSERAG